MELLKNTTEDLVFLIAAKIWQSGICDRAVEPLLARWCGAGRK